jgi:hypothetical protein
MKEKIKYIMNRLISKSPYAVVVASCGRSGSTMLTRALAQSAVRDVFHGFDGLLPKKVAEKAVIEYAWRLDDTRLRPGFIYKTHDLPPERFFENERYIYTYSSPRQVIPSIIQKMSREGKKWIRQHAHHLNGNVNPRKKMIKDDSLNLINNIEKWIDIESNKVLCIEYDNIWNKKDEIHEFTGIDLKLPKKRSRSSSTEDLTDEELYHLKNLQKKYKKATK